MFNVESKKESTYQYGPIIHRVESKKESTCQYGPIIHRVRHWSNFSPLLNGVNSLTNNPTTYHACSSYPEHT